ncbi:uncharacterized protein JCM10292_006190 [Rhodotorula paludigena]|uniref:uncharacterized protein n=1 Tax=Rhodotorula paludigena TaxID=86838 RepID=UPI00316FFE28
MGLADLFSGAGSGAAPPVPPKHEMDKDEVIRRLTTELVATRQRNQELEESSRTAVGARKAAVERVREVEDILRLKEGMFDSLERQVTLLEKYVADLQLKEAELTALRADMAEHPLSESDLQHRYDQLVEIFDSMKDTLSCAVCYEPYGRDEAVSLMCGHTFCQSCYSHWEERSIDAFKRSPVQGAYTGPECPECRTADVRRGRVRIWSLEEIVRLVDRATREIAHKPFVPPNIVGPKPVTGAELVREEDKLVKVDEPELPLTPASEAVTPFAELDERARQAEDGRDSSALAVQPDAMTDLMDIEEAEQLAVEPAAQALGADLASDAEPAEPAELSTASESPAVFQLNDVLARQMLEAHARERAESRARALEQAEREAQDAQRIREEEEEREAREARDQVLFERTRTPYGAVFR